jgi:hypothetical protein
MAHFAKYFAETETKRFDGYNNLALGSSLDTPNALIATSEIRKEY